MVDLVNKSEQISGFAYPYEPILVNIIDEHHQASAKSILLNPTIAL